MSSVHYLRSFICERLTAAAVEILGAFERTIVQYEEEIDRQRKQFDTNWKPGTKGKGFPHQRVCEEEMTLTDEGFPNQRVQMRLPSSVNQRDEPEASQIKEEQEELCAVQHVEQLALKQEPETWIVTLTCGESDREPEPGSRQRLSSASGSQNDQESKRVDSGSDRTAERSPDDADGGKKLKCDICGKAFKDKYQLKKHQKIHTGEKPFVCEACGKRFIWSTHLKSHMQTHADEKPYPCDTCGKRFMRVSDLKVHRRIHSGEKPFVCSTCGKSFTSTSNMKTHMRTHTGERPYVCATCGKGFIQASDLTSHVRTHTGEKPYLCAACGKRFIQISNLKSHMKVHTRETTKSGQTQRKRLARSGHFSENTETSTDETL